MIRLSNGVQFELLAASGARAFNGNGWWFEQLYRRLGLLDFELFTFVTKTLYRHPNAGNLRWYKPWDCIRPIKDGFVNAVGNTNRGIEWWIKYIYPDIHRRRLRTIVSIFTESVAETEEMIKMFNPLDITAIELVHSCPNIGQDLSGNTRLVKDCARAARNLTSIPVIVKLGFTQEYANISYALTGIVEAVHLINTIPHDIILPHETSPLAHYKDGGGVSGPIIRPFALEAIRRTKSLTTTTVSGRTGTETFGLPIIGGGGIETFDDLLAFRQAGADAFSIGTLFLRSLPWHPRRPDELARQWCEYIAHHPSTTKPAASVAV